MLAAGARKALNVDQNLFGVKGFQRPHRVVVFGAEHLHQLRLLGVQHLFQGRSPLRGGKSPVYGIVDFTAFGFCYGEIMGAQDDLHRLLRHCLIQRRHPAAAGLHRQIQRTGQGSGKKIQKPEYLHGSASKGLFQAAGRRLGRIGFKQPLGLFKGQAAAPLFG